jgi:hypothetical protein
LQVVRPYVHFTYAAVQEQVAGNRGQDLEDRYDPFYVHAVSERLLDEEEDQLRDQ